MALSWLGWALAATVVWGLGTLASKPATDRLGPRTIALGATLVEGLMFGAVGLFFFPLLPLPANPVFVVTAVLAGGLGAVGYIFFYEGMRLGSVGLVGTISAACPVLTVVLSVLFLSETLGSFQIAGIALTILCVVLLAYEPNKRDASRRMAVALSLVGFFVWGLWGFLVKASVDALGEGNLDLLLAGAYLVVTVTYAAFRRPQVRPDPKPSRRMWGLAGFVFFSGAFGAIGLTIAYDLGPAALVGPVSGTYPVVATLGAAAFLREKIDARILAALVAFVLGIALLSVA